MEVRIAGCNKESIVDGKGIRYTIYMQGCKHNCKGCQNPTTHDMLGGDITDTDELLEDIKKYKWISGVTLSGGDPFFQAKQAKVIADGVHKLNKNVWCYTGYTIEQIMSSTDDDIRGLLSSIDVLVDGRYEDSLRSLDLAFRGSSNQRLIDVKSTLELNKVVTLDL